MQLNLFEWDLIAVTSGLKSLAGLDFDGARNRFAHVLQSVPDHPEAGKGMRDLQYWQGVLKAMAGLETEPAIRLLWDAIRGFAFDSSENYRQLRHNLIRHLLALMAEISKFFQPPDLCSGYLYLQLGETEAAERHLRDLIADWPDNGLLHLYLAESLWMQGRVEIAGPAYSKALLLAPLEIAAKAVSYQPLAAIVQEYGPAMAPIHGYLEGILPLVEHDALPDKRETRIYGALRRAEQARRTGNHQAMIAARRDLKNLAHEIFEKYLNRLGR